MGTNGVSGTPASVRSRNDQILLVGLNHHTAPIPLRERLAFRPAELAAAGDAFRQECGLSECVIVSTCNRAEFYVSGESVDEDCVLSFLAGSRQVEIGELRSHCYFRHGLDAVRHLCHVACGVDSMVVGESQILKQVKTAAATAMSAHTAGPILAAVFRQAVTAGKRARTETTIARGAVSISHAAVELARQIFGDLASCRALVLGAGEMGEITLKLLRNAGMRAAIMISSRTREHTEALAERCGGFAVEWSTFPDTLAHSDIVIVSTSAPHYVVKPETVRQAMHSRRGQPIFLIDISVPRNVDPTVDQLPDVFLYNIDDLQQVVDRNLGDRSREIEKVDEIVEEEVERFQQWRNNLGVVPAILGLRTYAESVRQDEWNRVVGKLAHLSDRDRQTMEAITRELTSRLLERPMAQLKALGVNGKGYDRVEVVLDLFSPDTQAQARIEPDITLDDSPADEPVSVAEVGSGS
jgi:glutamyl-tRNA reductase